MLRVCFYITAHGFGHASRCQAVAAQLLAERPDAKVELRTGAPRWFFDWLLGERCTLTRPTCTLDPGVVQSDSFHHDVPATLHAWQELLARQPALVADEAEHLRRSACQVVVSDVAPLPLAAARRANLPAVAMGNFTWDWVLEGYLDREPRFAPVVDGVRLLYRQADLYLRLPLSHDTDLFRSQRHVGFTTRRSRLAPEDIRAKLGLDPDHLVVLLSFGGFGVASLGLDRVERQPGVRCVWDRGPGVAPALISARGMGLHYPDLIRAADVILTKPGYSIISEAVAQRTLLAYAPRRGFRESELLEPFLEERWPSLAVAPTSLADGRWVEEVVPWTRARLGAPMPEIAVDGAAEAVRAILELA